MINILKDKFYHLKFKTQHNFELVRSFEGSCRFKSDVLSAFQLANNYEADLYLNGHLIFSPLAFDWDENAKLIKKYLGKSFVKPDRWDLKGYKDFSDVELVK